MSGGGSTGSSGGSTGSTASGANASSTNSSQATGINANSFAGGQAAGFIATSTTGGGSIGSSSSGFNANSSSSPVASSYASPLYSGKPSGNYASGTIGGFGANLYTWNAPQNNITGRVTNTTQTAGGGMQNNMNNSTTTGRRFPRYSSSVRFPVHTPNATQLHGHARAAIANATTLPSYQNIQVTLDGNTIVLRGRVTDDDERRLAENVLRLTPGIRDIRNELSVSGETSTVARQTP